eukprot:COSAG01_NODE_2015_length_8643_cov_8.718984_3_plen_159_part_00
MENTLVVFEYNRPASCLHYMSYECLQGAFFHLCITERLARPRNDYVSPPGAASSCTYMRGNTPFRSVLPNMCPFHHCFSCITIAQLTQHDFRLRNQREPHIAITPTASTYLFALCNNNQLPCLHAEIPSSVRREFMFDACPDDIRICKGAGIILDHRD